MISVARAYERTMRAAKTPSVLAPVCLVRTAGYIAFVSRKLLFFAAHNCFLYTLYQRYIFIYTENVFLCVQFVNEKKMDTMRIYIGRV